MEQTISFMGQLLRADTERVYSRGVDVELADVESLRRLPKLKALNLNTTNTTDEHLRIISQLTSLEDLDASTADITDDGVAYLCALTNLKHLRIKENNITDAGIRCLQSLVNLETLNLKDLPITDAGLRFLEPLLRLERVVFSFPDAQFTRGGLERLQQRLPNCDIVAQYTPWETTGGGTAAI